MATHTPGVEPRHAREVMGHLHATNQGKALTVQPASLRLGLVPVVSDQGGDLRGEGFLPGGKGFHVRLELVLRLQVILHLDGDRLVQRVRRIGRLR